MTTGILVGLTIVLVLAAVGVGLLLLRRQNASTATPPAGESPQTVSDLVRLRTTPADDRSGNQLFTPSTPRAGMPVTARPVDGPRPASPVGAEARTVAVPVPSQGSTAAPPTGEAGDAPWRRAARMMGAEPGAGWDTAPLPVVPAADVPRPNAPAAAVRAPGAEPRATGPTATGPTAAGSTAAGPQTAGSTSRQPVAAEPDPARVEAAQPQPAVVEPTAAEPPVAQPTAAQPIAAQPAPVEPAPVEPAHVEAADTHEAARPAPADRITEPVALPAVVPGPAAPAAERPRPTPTRRPGAAPVWTLPETVDADKPTAPLDRAAVDEAGPHPAGPNEAALDETAPNEPGQNRSGPDEPGPSRPTGSDGPSRPLSDPDLTPLMGIPIVRPLTADEPPPPAVVAESRATPRVPRTNRVLVDEEVVSMSPATGVRPAPVVRTGSPQPVWFRVVRRDGEPVAGAVVALLDDHGHEVDATKTATDGGGELHTPHGGRFLMVTSAEGFQPRAVLLTVEGQPVELALLLPRSAVVSGTVRSATRLVAGARVVARQEGEIVDDLVTGRDGGYRFDDLAEGSYVLSATDHRGSVVQPVRLAEGADVPLDLELVYREGAR